MQRVSVGKNETGQPLGSALHICTRGSDALTLWARKVRIACGRLVARRSETSGTVGEHNANDDMLRFFYSMTLEKPLWKRLQQGCLRPYFVHSTYHLHAMIFV